MEFLNALFSCATFPINTKPTRVTNSTTTTIDHVITNVMHQEILPGKWPTEIF